MFLVGIARLPAFSHGFLRYLWQTLVLPVACYGFEVFPFPDGVEKAIAHGILDFVQPAGSIRDDEVVAVVDKSNGVMMKTSARHFRH